MIEQGIRQLNSIILDVTLEYVNERAFLRAWSWV